MFLDFPQTRVLTTPFSPDWSLIALSLEWNIRKTTHFKHFQYFLHTMADRLRISTQYQRSYCFSVLCRGGWFCLSDYWRRDNRRPFRRWTKRPCNCHVLYRTAVWSSNWANHWRFHCAASWMAMGILGSPLCGWQRHYRKYHSELGD